MEETTSLTPYFLRAFYDWSMDNGLTPQINAILNNDPQLSVPRAYANGSQITFNIGPYAARNLELGNDFVKFDATFNGVAESIQVPVGNIEAVFVRETGFGIPFEVKLKPDQEPAPRRGFTRVD